MNTNFNIYATNPFPNFTRTNFERADEMAETITARRIRKRLYQNDNVKIKHQNTTTKTQKQRKAKEMALAILVDPNSIDTEKIADIMTQWAKDDIGIDETVGKRIFSNALITTESIPQRSTLKIRIKF